jgi:hypothetical protein
VVELGECDGGAAGAAAGDTSSEASDGSCDDKNMIVSVSMNVTRLRELEEAVDEEEGDEEGMKKSNSKTVERPVLSAQILVEPSEQQLGKSRRNKIPHKMASPRCKEEGKALVEMEVKERRMIMIIKSPRD